MKHSIYFVGRALGTFAVLEQRCFFQIPVAYICKLTYNIFTHKMLTSQSRSGGHLHFRWPRHFIHSSHLHPTAFHMAVAARDIYSNQAILTTFQTMGWSTISSPLTKIKFLSSLFYFSYPKKLFINKGTFFPDFSYNLIYITLT